MLESTREFLKELKASAHDDRVAVVDMEKALTQQNSCDNYLRAHKEKEAKEKAKIERYRRGEYTPQERKATAEAMKGVLKDLKKRINADLTREAKLADRLSQRNAAQEGREQIERLLEIAQDRNDYLTARIEAATAQENEYLLEKYTQEKAKNDKDLKLYRSKYEEYKGATQEGTEAKTPNALGDLGANNQSAPPLNLSSYNMGTEKPAVIDLVYRTD